MADNKLEDSLKALEIIVYLFFIYNDPVVAIGLMMLRPIMGEFFSYK